MCNVYTQSGGSFRLETVLCGLLPLDRFRPIIIIISSSIIMIIIMTMIIISMIIFIIMMFIIIIIISCSSISRRRRPDGASPSDDLSVQEEHLGKESLFLLIRFSFLFVFLFLNCDKGHLADQYVHFAKRWHVSL